MRTTSQASKLALAIIALWFGLSAESRTEANYVINTPAGLAAGATFRIVFVTDGVTAANSTSISTYNTFVGNDATTQAGGGNVLYNGTILTWSAIASTSSTSALSNIGETGASVWLANGPEVSTTDTGSGLWSGTLLKPISTDLKGFSQVGGTWTGSFADGNAIPGSQLGTPDPANGFIGSTNSAWIFQGSAQDAFSMKLYGISQVLTVPPASVPEPSSLTLTVVASVAAIAVGLFRKRRGQKPQGPEGQPESTE